MTETEWLSSTDPAAMMQYIRHPNDGRGVWNIHGLTPPSDRKLRLFACACCRQVCHLLVDDSPCPKCLGNGKRQNSCPTCRHWDGYNERCPTCKGRGTEGKPYKCPNCSGTGRINRSRRAVEVAEKLAEGID